MIRGTKNSWVEFNTEFEITKVLSKDNRLRYVYLVNKITGSNVVKRTCNNSLKKAHSLFTSYIVKNS